MPRSHLKASSWRALALSLVFAVFVSLIIIEAGAQGARSRNSSQFQPNSAAALNALQSRRKNIASVRSVDNANSSRVLITSDVPLNDYAAYWSGDRYYVVIPDADLVSRDIQSMQNSLRGRGFQEVRIERKGNDVVISFRLLPGMRARVEQKFNRLEVVFTPPAGSSTFNPNPDTGRTRPTQTGTGGQQTTTSRTPTTGTGTTGTTGTGTTGTGTTTTSSGNTSQSGTTASSGGGGGGGGGGRTGGRRGGTRVYSGGGGGGGGGVPLNIPLPSEMQPEASTSPIPSASPSASPSTTEPTAISSPLPDASPLSTPAQIAQNQPQQPITAPPISTSTQQPAPAPASTSTGFAAAVREYWLPLLIGLFVLLVIGLLMISRSRAGDGEATATKDSTRLATTKKETIKEKPGAGLSAALAGGAAGAATAAAVTRESRTKAEPSRDTAEQQKKETKAVEPVAPAVPVERVGTEVKSLLEGKDYDEGVIASTNPDTRQMVSTELLAALASRNPERRLRAREAFAKHGFFDDATRRLRTADVPAERISAARALGLTQDHTATPHLTAALEDTDAEVRRAAVNALAEVRDPSAIGPLNSLLEREKSRKVPHSLIRRAIEASATIDVAGQPAAETAAPTPTSKARDTAATTADKKDKDDEDREVFEI